MDPKPNYMISAEPVVSAGNAESLFMAASAAPADTIIGRSARILYNVESNEKERIGAELCVDLVERYGYPLMGITVAETVAVVASSGSLEYLEADILALGEKGVPLLIVEVVAPGAYLNEREAALKKLFRIGGTLAETADVPCMYLVYYTHTRVGDVFNRNCTIVDYACYQTYTAWREAGGHSQSIGEIPYGSSC